MPIAIVSSLLAGCSSALKSSSPAQIDIGPPPDVRVGLNAYGLPTGFFQPDAETKCGNQIIGYRFVVWLNDQDVAVGFNVSPNCRQSPDRKVDGLARMLVFNVSGGLKARRDIPYLADGYGELVAHGEVRPGPGGTLLFRMQSVNLDETGRNESKSGFRLFDASLKDVTQVDEFLEQTTFVKHALVFQHGFVLTGPRTYSVLDGAPPAESQKWTLNWPVGTRDRKFGEHGFAFVLCSQELRPGEYTPTNVIYSGANLRCAVNVRGEDADTSVWTAPLKDGENAEIVGLLADGGVVGKVLGRGNSAGRLVVWNKGAISETLPWLPQQFDGTVDSATSDISRYATFATNDAHPCNPLVRILGTCDEGGGGRWFVFDRRSQIPVVNRAFPRNGRAALSPNGLHYASFESNELRIFTIPTSK
ncbi:MAG TPA: hypothetical protein VN776_12275 [Terracidiphilus sp.]|nr:hypothetical protein [Terracidiphilus sp.]